MSTPADPFQLSRFVEAQATSFCSALVELRAGCKTSHWIWYVFPQLSGLGRSAIAERYGLSGSGEAVAYLAHPLLGSRLREAIQTMLAHQSGSAASILGELDAMKLRSCLTLFHLAVPGDELFSLALERLFASCLDPITVQRLAVREP